MDAKSSRGKALAWHLHVGPEALARVEAVHAGVGAGGGVERAIVVSRPQRCAPQHTDQYLYNLLLFGT